MATQLSPELLAARKTLSQCLSETNAEKALGLEDQLQVIDRLIKIELLEHKMGKGKAGSALDDDDEELG